MDNPNIDAFNADTDQNGGYRYTTNARLSSRTANKTLTDASLALIDLRGKSVLDVGCGDGTYTVELYDRSGPSSVHGFDPATTAIAAAGKRVGSRRITLSVGSAYELPYADGSYDVAYLRGVLHHMDRPFDAIREALRVARQIIVIEPNGYNPILKVLEKCSRYHIEHDEKSYTPRRLRRWVEEAGGAVTDGRLAGLVPMFCPDWMVRVTKFVEPAVERIPLLNALGCAVYVFVAERRPATARMVA